MGGVLPYVSYMGTFRSIGYHFQGIQFQIFVS